MNLRWSKVLLGVMIALFALTSLWLCVFVVNSDLSEATLTGAWISISAAVVIASLLGLVS